MAARSTKLAQLEQRAAACMEQLSQQPALHLQDPAALLSTVQTVLQELADDPHPPDELWLTAANEASFTWWRLAFSCMQQPRPGVDQRSLGAWLQQNGECEALKQQACHTWCIRGTAHMQAVCTSAESCLPAGHPPQASPSCRQQH